MIDLSSPQVLHLGLISIGVSSFQALPVLAAPCGPLSCCLRMHAAYSITEAHAGRFPEEADTEGGQLR